MGAQKSRMRKAFVLRAKKLRARVEKANLSRPRMPKQKQEIPVTYVHPLAKEQAKAARRAERDARQAAKNGTSVSPSGGI